MKRRAMTLIEQMRVCDCNGAVFIDAGNGCAGPKWIDLDEMPDDMRLLECYQQANDEAFQAIRDVAGYEVDTVPFITDWQVVGVGDNPYRFRLAI